MQADVPLYAIFFLACQIIFFDKIFFFNDKKKIFIFSKKIFFPKTTFSTFHFHYFKSGKMRYLFIIIFLKVESGEFSCAHNSIHWHFFTKSAKLKSKNHRTPFLDTITGGEQKSLLSQNVSPLKNVRESLQKMSKNVEKSVSFLTIFIRKTLQKKCPIINKL